MRRIPFWPSWDCSEDNMKVLRSAKKGHRYSGATPAQRIPSTRRRKTAAGSESLVPEIVQEFKQAVKKRPKDLCWLIKYGRLARSMGLTYAEAFSVVKPHFKKLRGNTRNCWINRGLTEGYNMGGPYG